MTEIIMKGAREEIKDGGGKREGLRQKKYNNKSSTVMYFLYDS